MKGKEELLVFLDRFVENVTPSYLNFTLKPCVAREVEKHLSYMEGIRYSGIGESNVETYRGPEEPSGVK